MKRMDERERKVEFWRLERWGSPILGVLIIALMLMVIAVSNAETTEAGAGYCAREDCDTQGHERWGHKGRRHGFFNQRRGHDPELAREHMQYATGWMLRRLDVDDAAQEQIQTRLDTAFAELTPLIESHKDVRATWLDTVLLADEVDRAALEARRQDAIAAADRASQIFASTLADVAEMLTPEQRAELAEQIRSHHR